MNAPSIARRLVEKYGPATAHARCRERVAIAYARAKDGPFFLWARIGELVERIGNAESWT